MSTTKNLLLAGAVFVAASATSTSAYAFACPCTPANQTAQAHMKTRLALTTQAATMMAQLYYAFTQATGQMTSARQVELRQLGGYFDGQVQELHKLKDGEARNKAQKEAAPPRTLCEIATGGSGLRAAQTNQKDMQRYLSDMTTAAIVGREGTAAHNGPYNYANAKFARTMTLYCDPLSVNNDVNSPCIAGDENYLVDADINPSKTLFSTNLTINTDEFDAANDLVMNVVMPMAPETLRGSQLSTAENRMALVEQRGTDARRSTSAAALNGLVGDVTPSTPMAPFVRSIQGEEVSDVYDGQENVSKRELLAALLSDRVMNGTYHLKLADMSNNVALLKELNNNLALTQIALNERIQQNRQLILLNSALVGSLEDSNPASTSGAGLTGQVIPTSGN